MITTQKNEQTNKQTKSNRNRLRNKKTCICIVVIQGNENILMNFAAVSVKMLETVKCFPKVLFKIVITDLCLLPCFCILYKRRLKMVTKVFMYKVVLLKFKIPEPKDVQSICDGTLLS